MDPAVYLLIKTYISHNQLPYMGVVQSDTETNDTPINAAVECDKIKFAFRELEGIVSQDINDVDGYLSVINHLRASLMIHLYC